jgi:DNA repair photolyase
LQRLQSKGKYPTILLSSVTYPDRANILTKPFLVSGDVDLFKQFPACEVGVTVTTDEDKLGRELEVYAPKATSRLNALKNLQLRGLKRIPFTNREIYCTFLTNANLTWEA